MSQPSAPPELSDSARIVMNLLKQGHMTDAANKFGQLSQSVQNEIISNYESELTEAQASEFKQRVLTPGKRKGYAEGRRPEQGGRKSRKGTKGGRKSRKSKNTRRR